MSTNLLSTCESSSFGFPPSRMPAATLMRSRPFDASEIFSLHGKKICRCCGEDSGRMWWKRSTRSCAQGVEFGHKANEAIRTTKPTNCQGLRMPCIPSANGADILKWFTVLGLLSRPGRTAAIIRWKLSGVPGNPQCRAALFDNHEWWLGTNRSQGWRQHRTFTDSWLEYGRSERTAPTRPGGGDPLCDCSEPPWALSRSSGTG